VSLFRPILYSDQLSPVSKVLQNGVNFTAVQVHNNLTWLKFNPK